MSEVVLEVFPESSTILDFNADGRVVGRTAYLPRSFCLNCVRGLSVGIDEGRIGPQGSISTSSPNV